jgi:predicted nucleotide-binding protein
MDSLTRRLRGVKFDAKFLREALEKIDGIVVEYELDNNDYEIDTKELRLGRTHAVLRAQDMEVTRGDLEVGMDGLEEFLREVKEGSSSYRVNLHASSIPAIHLTVSFYGDTSVLVHHQDRDIRYKIMAIFEDAADNFKMPVEEAPRETVHIFLGHGGQDKEWLELLHDLQSQHELSVEAFETGARSGHSIRDILQGFLGNNTFAIVIFSKADELADGGFVPRQNVVHEAGLFQGRLGFSRVLMLVEKGAQLFSNIDGVQYVEYTAGNMKGSVGAILATLRREFPGGLVS